MEEQHAESINVCRNSGRATGQDFGRRVQRRDTERTVLGRGTEIHQEDVTANATLTAGRWHQARAARRDDLLRIEGEARFTGLQTFFQTVHDLTRERRLSRLAYVAEKPA